MSKKLIECRVTTKRIADHDYTVLYDKEGNAYLKLEKFDLGKSWEPRLDVTPTRRYSDFIAARIIFPPPHPEKQR